MEQNFGIYSLIFTEHLEHVYSIQNNYFHVSQYLHMKL